MTEPDVNLPEPDAPADQPPPGETLVVPEPPDAEQPAPDAQPWHLALRDKAARWLAGRGIGPVGLSGFALAPAGIGALALATEHPGMGGILGGLAVLPAWLALAPNEGGRTPPFPGLVAHALVPLWLGGVVVDAAAHGTSAAAALAAWTSFVLLLLPLARAAGGPGRLTSGPLLWAWGERAAALVVGVLLGRAGLAMFVTACITTADLVLRLVVLHPTASGASRLPPGLSALFGPDGKPQPGVRLAMQLALALFVVILIALGTADDWRF